VLIDGAHALAQLPLDLGALGADYLVSNCHKWLGGARGGALLWVQRALQGRVRPLVVSHGSGCGFLSDFIWDGEAGRALGPARLRLFFTSTMCDGFEGPKPMPVVFPGLREEAALHWCFETPAPWH
jgi:hypothetical protein